MTALSLHCWTVLSCSSEDTKHYWEKLINTDGAVVSGPNTQSCRLLLLKCISLTPVVVFYWTDTGGRLCSSSFHMNLITFISVFSLHVSFCSFIRLIPLLILCRSPHFLSVAVVSLASSELQDAIKSCVYQHKSGFSKLRSSQGGHLWWPVPADCILIPLKFH